MATEFDWSAAERDMQSVTLAERALMVYSVLREDHTRDLMLGAAAITHRILGPGYEASDVSAVTYANGSGNVYMTIQGLQFRAVLVPNLNGDTEWVFQLRCGNGEHTFVKIESIADIGRTLAEHTFYESRRKDEWSEWTS